MAAMAQFDQSKREVQVNRVKLISTLEANRLQHINDYNEAMAGYKSVLLSKVDEAFCEAKKQLEVKHDKAKTRVQELADEDIAKQRDSFTLIDSVVVEMKVPRSYVKEYDMAINMAKWDVRENLSLSHAEFACFILDQWDWKAGFDAISCFYKAAK